MVNVVMLEYGYRMINGVIFNPKMKIVSESEYKSIIESKRSVNDWQTLEPSELKDIIDGTKGAYIRDKELVIGIDHNYPFVVKTRKEFDGRVTILFKLIEVEELSYWLWKMDETFEDKLNFIVSSFDIDMELAKIFEGFKITEFIFNDYIYRIIIGIDSDYIKIKKVAKAPTIETNINNNNENIFDKLGI